ncbi:MAG: methylated-DNA--[protein]-cysteine S-methyltransferase [Candidatus Aminicenantes bacterium]|nr:methylated-DNA--[protein]-cysteine S-methyltransferase [Candidatus Aminicenantes bacterium]
MYYTQVSFPMGKILLIKSNKGLSIAKYLKAPNEAGKLLSFLKNSSFTLKENDKLFKPEKELFYEYFNGKQTDFTCVPIDFISGTPFQKKVWLETRKIPYGKTEAYKSIGEKLGQKGFQSIGQALSRNPLIIIVPCHRVLKSDGTLGGFSAGLKLKDYLLRLEQGNVPI